MTAKLSIGEFNIRNISAIHKSKYRLICAKQPKTVTVLSINYRSCAHVKKYISKKFIYREWQKGEGERRISMRATLKSYCIVRCIYYIEKT